MIEVLAEALADTTSEGAFGTGANSARIGCVRPLEIPAKTKMSINGTDLSAGVDGLSVLAFRGPDAARFLQGQLSADVEKMAPGDSRLAGLHTPQGRVIALLALVRASTEEVLAVLPRALMDPVATRLRKYVLRAKVQIDADSAAWRVTGANAATEIGLAGQHSIAWGMRKLVLSSGSGADAATVDAQASARWARADIADGLPQVYAATSETFVAQMLNLDLLGAIAFDKGCYTGQEVVARAHYRGRVKRRMQRWLNASNTVLAPGDAARTADGRALAVVRVAALEDGGQEVLAVGNFAKASDEAAALPGPDGDKTGVLLQGPLPLPYSLPD
jgi:folate-binding protein YgfZ